MSQADNARIEALEAQVKEQDERIAQLEKQVGQLRERAEGKDMMPEVYPTPTEPPRGRR